MRSAPARRLALLAVVVLLAPAWARPGPAATVLAHAGSVMVAPGPAAGAVHAPDTATPAPATRRPPTAAWWLSRARPDEATALAALALAVLLSLLAPLAWARVRAARSAPTSLVRRRYAIALRAPPLPSCT